MRQTSRPVLPNNRMRIPMPHHVRMRPAVDEKDNRSSKEPANETLTP